MKKRRVSQKSSDKGHVSDTGDDSFVYGYDPEHRQAWRQKPGSRNKEWALTFRKPDVDEGGSDDALHPIAVFSDGSERPIVSLTMKDLKLEELLKKCARGKLWHSGKRYISYRKDRNPLLILFQEKADPSISGPDKQLCQITVSVFGDPSEEVVPRATEPSERCLQTPHLPSPPRPGILAFVNGIGGGWWVPPCWCLLHRAAALRDASYPH
jgi:hypothetical protein